ncbi:MAG: hypothetical protein IKH65_08540 [Clostridia bacterium]|jgi:hypothetical protein|nr:hypothetical protein [Clostridia bacterium]
MEQDILMYKDRPLVRHGNTIYYGYMDQPYVAILQIMSTREFQGEQIADKVTVQLFRTDPNITKLKDKIVKKAEGKGLYSALDIGSIWLERELKQK